MTTKKKAAGSGSLSQAETVVLAQLRKMAKGDDQRVTQFVGTCQRALAAEGITKTPDETKQVLIALEEKGLLRIARAKTDERVRSWTEGFLTPVQGVPTPDAPAVASVPPRKPLKVPVKVIKSTQPPAAKPEPIELTSEVVRAYRDHPRMLAFLVENERLIQDATKKRNEAIAADHRVGQHHKSFPQVLELIHFDLMHKK